MKRVVTGVTLLALGLIPARQAAGLDAAQQPAGPSLAASHQSAAESDAPPESPNTVVRQYCVRCHNERTSRGNLSLAIFDVARAHERAETAERMIVKLRAGMMPPPGTRRPAADALLALVESLETEVDGAAATHPDPGARRFQRLNRPEYEHVIRHLLGLEVNAGRWLPADTYLGNFDNMSTAQGLSTTLLEAYLRAASDVSRLAVGSPHALSATVKHTNPIEISQHAWDHIEGTPYGTRGGMAVLHDFPADGEYILTIETLFGKGMGFADLDISIDGEGVALVALEHGGGESLPIRTDPIFMRAGQHRVAAAFVRRIDGPYEDRLSPHAWSFVGGEDSQAWANYGITALPHLSELLITGPAHPTGLSETASRRKIFTCRPAAPADERAGAGAILSRLASQAYPDFTGQLRHDLVRETQLFFDALVREDRSLLDLFTADYTFLDERLASHYGIPGVAGDEFRQVSYPDDGRRGILGHGSVLLLTSMSARTSPVLRGKWVMEVLMGTPPPPPPPNVPAFEETAGASEGRRLTTRERLEMHRANPMCRSCHRFMDPIGLALDRYDVTGRLRTRENGVPLDTRGTFYDGTEVSSPSELIDALMKRPVPLVRNFAANLLAYAIGRRVEYSDQPEIRAIARYAGAHDYRMSSFIHGIVMSRPFQMSRTRAATGSEADQEQ